jgi:hypothetical protein
MYRYNLSFRCDGNTLEIDESDDKKSLEETIKALKIKEEFKNGIFSIKENKNIKGNKILRKIKR